MSKEATKHDASLKKLVRFNELMDLYGDLLTDKQQRMARMHYEDDLSFSEIAKEEGVSRQAVHDAVKHASMTLEKIETKLQILQTNAQALAPDASSAVSSQRFEEAVEILTQLRDKIRRSPSVLYTTEWIVKDLDKAIETLSNRNKG